MEFDRVVGADRHHAPISPMQGTRINALQMEKITKTPLKVT